MKKILIITSIGFNILCAGYILFSNKTIQRSHVQSMCSLEKAKRRNVKTYRVAVIKPSTHGLVDTVERGFFETVHSFNDICVLCTSFNANGSEVLLRSITEEVIQKKYDFIVPIGAHASTMALRVTSKRNNLIPIIFCCVADPARLKLVKSEQSSGNHVTGASTKTNYPEQISFLCKLKKDIKNVLLVYDPTQSSGLERDKREVEQLLLQRGISLKAVEVYHTNDLKKKVQGLISGMDVLLTFKDNTVLPGRNILIKLCNQYGVTYYATDLDSVSDGAALGYGVFDFDFGVATAQQLKRLILEGKKPHELPVLATNDYKLLVNMQAAQQQGLNIDKELFRLLQATSITKEG